MYTPVYVMVLFTSVCNDASVAAPKVSPIFQGKFSENLALKIESFRNFATILKFSEKIVISKL